MIPKVIRLGNTYMHTIKSAITLRDLKLDFIINNLYLSAETLYKLVL